MCHWPDAEQLLWRLKYSRAEIQATLVVIATLPQIRSPNQQPLSASSQYHLFRQIGAAFPALAVLAVASGVSTTAIAPLIERYFTPADPIAHPSPLVTEFGYDNRAVTTYTFRGQLGFPEWVITLHRKQSSCCRSWASQHYGFRQRSELS